MSKLSKEENDRLLFRVYDDMIFWHSRATEMHYITPKKVMEEAMQNGQFYAMKPVSKSKFFYLTQKMERGNKVCMDGEVYQEFGTLNLSVANGWISNPLFEKYLEANFNLKTGDHDNPRVLHYYRLSEKELKMANYLSEHIGDLIRTKEEMEASTPEDEIIVKREQMMMDATGLNKEEMEEAIVRLLAVNYVRADAIDGPAADAEVAENGSS